MLCKMPGSYDKMKQCSKYVLIFVQAIVSNFGRIAGCSLLLLVATGASIAVLAGTTPDLSPERGYSISSQQDKPVVVFAAGDVMLGRGVVSKLYRQQTPLQKFAPQIRAADVAFCNLECVFTSKTERSAWKPRLFVSPSAVHYLSEAGINVVSVANNHAFDAGEPGVRETMSTLRKAGIASVGMNEGNGFWPASETLVGGMRIAWLAASAYGPWQDGHIRMRNIAGSKITEQVHALTKRGDFVFVSLHWGNEFSRSVTAGQVQLAHRLIDAGAVAVVGHHPHVVQSVEVYRGKPIFYSLGNFVFDHLPGSTQDGMAVCVSLFPSRHIQFHMMPLTLSSPRNIVRKVSPNEHSIKVPLPTGEKLVKALPGYFLKGETSQQVLVWSKDSNGEGTIRAYFREPGGWRCLAEGHHPAIFSVQVGDIDRDGQDEIILGLIQRSKLDVRSARRLYIYSVSKAGLFQPRWRGSGLSRPFRQFCLLPTRSGCDLVALEKDGAPELRQFEWLSVYRWNGFGLRRLWNTPVRGRVQDVGTGRDENGSFITFTRILPDGQQRLILRRAIASYDALESNTDFVSHLQQAGSSTHPDVLETPSAGENAGTLHDPQAQRQR